MLSITENINDHGVSVNVNADGDIFIFPNDSKNLYSFYYRIIDGMREYGNRLALDNNTTFDENSDYFVETWIVSEDLQTDSLSEHSFKIDINGITYSLRPGEINRHILHHMLDFKEGESKIINFNNIIVENVDNKDDTLRINLSMNLTASQLKYRYKIYGAFHDVLRKVCC